MKAKWEGPIQLRRGLNKQLGLQIWEARIIVCEEKGSGYSNGVGLVKRGTVCLKQQSLDLKGKGILVGFTYRRTALQRE